MAEQIGSQIFIDGWAKVAPGDPDFAADLARRQLLSSSRMSWAWISGSPGGENPTG